MNMYNKLPDGVNLPPGCVDVLVGVESLDTGNFLLCILSSGFQTVLPMSEIAASHNSHLETSCKYNL